MPVSKKRKKKPSKSTNKVQTSNQMKALSSRVEKLKNDKGLISGTYEKNVSDMLAEYAEPLTEDSQNEEQTKRAIEFAIMGWNTAVLNKREGNNSALERVVDALRQHEPGREELLKKDLEVLIERKNEMFPDEDVLIADYELSFDSKGNIKLSVASVINKQ